jgi:diguanylate cyclase (GGDEF)-like protein
MKAAGGARNGGARRQSRWRLRKPGGLLRIGAAASLILALAVLVCAAIGLAEAERSNGLLATEQHAALHDALAELGGGMPASGRFDADTLRRIGRRAGLHDLRFDTDLAADRAREVQSLHDAQGRIIGWFSWAPDRGFIGAMAWLWGLLGLVGIALASAAYITVRAARRLNASFARSLATIRKLTTQDTLTGLPNRRVMLECLDEAVATRGARFVVFALIDIDGFHDVNDTLGRAGGDAMLCSIAERLKAALPQGAIFGRFEDDAFAAVVMGDDAQLAAKFGETLSGALAASFYMDQLWQISASIGIAKAPENGTAGDELQRHAALALRTAKRGGRGSVRHFVPEIQAEHSERRFFLRELERAIAQNAFDVHYQPIVAAEGGGMIGVEALLRWNHPTRGAIAPSLFIPLAEESGLMIRLGEVVLRRALADGIRWPNLFVSINLSPMQIRSRGLADFVASVLADTGMAASRIVLEITEGILIDDPEETQHKLEALRALGLSIALDDFGTGYSSLSYLQKFHFDRVKIDRTFVASLGTTGNAGAIIQSIVTLGHALGMKVLAEGIETNEQRVLLRLAGCDEMQGFLFAKAVPAEAIDRILAKPAAARVARQNGDAAS